MGHIIWYDSKWLKTVWNRFETELKRNFLCHVKTTPNLFASRVSPWSRDVDQRSFEPIFAKAVVSRVYGLGPVLTEGWEVLIQDEKDLSKVKKTSSTRYLSRPTWGRLPPVEISWFADSKPWPKNLKGCRVDMRILLRHYSRNKYCFTIVYLIGQIFISVQRVQLTFNFIICYDIILCLEEIFKDFFSPCSVGKVLLINNHYTLVLLRKLLFWLWSSKNKALLWQYGLAYEIAFNNFTI